MGINVLGASQLLGYPSQYPSVSLLDWNDGFPNPRYRVLQLLMKNCHLGDTLVASRAIYPDIYSMPFLDRNGQRKLMLVNKSPVDKTVMLPGINGGTEEHVDVLSLNAPAVINPIDSAMITLRRFSVVIVTYPPTRRLQPRRP
jgi:hypothetical protein